MPIKLRYGCASSAICHMRDEIRGMAAIEFAVVAPILILAMIGFFETVRVVRAKSMLTAAASGLVDMIAADDGVPVLTPGIMQDFCRGAQLTMRPFGTATLSAAVVSVTNLTTTPAGPARDWEYDAACPSAATVVGANSAVSLAGPMVPGGGDSVIMVKASFRYVPSAVLPAFTFTKTVFARPRYGRVSCPSC